MNFWRPINSAKDLPPIDSRESECLDFKAQGYGKSGTERCEAARDVVQFANHLGGTIILGAKEENHCLKEYVDLPDIAEQLTRVRDICIERVEPSISLDPVEIDENGKKVLAVNVFPSFCIVAVRVSSNRYEFPVRRNDRRCYLTFQEVEMMGTPERRGFLLLESIPPERRGKIRVDAEDLNSISPRGWSLETVCTSHAMLKFSQINVYIPLAFIEAVWPSDSYGEYTITIRARLSLNNGKLEISRAKKW